MGMEGDCRAEPSGGNGEEPPVGTSQCRIHDGLRLLSQHREGLRQHQAGLKGDAEGLQKPKMIHLHKSFRLILSLFIFFVDSADKICVTDWDNSVLIPSPVLNSSPKKKKKKDSGVNTFI